MVFNGISQCGLSSRSDDRSSYSMKMPSEMGLDVIYFQGSVVSRTSRRSMVQLFHSSGSTLHRISSIGADSSTVYGSISLTSVQDTWVLFPPNAIASTGAALYGSDQANSASTPRPEVYIRAQSAQTARPGQKYSPHTSQQPENSLYFVHYLDPRFI